MEILYLTLIDPALGKRGIYSDLLNACLQAGHRVTAVFADSPKNTQKTVLKQERGADILYVKTGEMFGVGFLKKGINTLLVEPRLTAAIKKHLKGRHYDVVLYATPPVTFASVVKYCRRAYGCASYLMLKDIFPQNAVDIGLFAAGGPIHRLFLYKEKQLYGVSDHIGCMSEKNISYVREHNPETAGKLELFPNTERVEPLPAQRLAFLSGGICAFEQRQKWGIPKDRTVFVFGGNLGKPQAVDYLLRAVKAAEMEKNAFFLFVGNGGESERVREAVAGSENARFIDFMPPEEYNALIAECDVGIISLDVRFSIPNYPSRTLGYMSMAMPILACTDNTTDVRQLIEQEAACGLWNLSDDVEGFLQNVKKLVGNPAMRIKMGRSGREYFEGHFDVKRSVSILEEHFNG